MTNTHPPVVTVDTSPENIAHWQSLTGLNREAAFYQGAWEEMRTFVEYLGEQLVVEHGFTSGSTSPGEQAIGQGLMLNLFRESDTATHIVQIPSSIHAFFEPTPLGEADGPARATPGTRLTASAIRADGTSLQIQPLANLLHILQSLYPGLITITRLSDDGEVSGVPRGLPPVAWLKKYEGWLRDGPGCTWVRRLQDCAALETRGMLEMPLETREGRPRMRVPRRDVSEMMGTAVGA